MSFSSCPSEGKDFVYIKDKTYSWIPAKVLSREGNSVSVKIELNQDWNKKTANVNGVSLEDGEERKISLLDYDNNELPLQNVDADGKLIVKPDMVDLKNLNEAACLMNLKDRHFNCIPYSRVGNITIAMNPFQWLTHLYSEENKKFYADSLLWNGTSRFDPYITFIFFFSLSL